jgi:hypothetical protein
LDEEKLNVSKRTSQQNNQKSDEEGTTHVSTRVSLASDHNNNKLIQQLKQEEPQIKNKLQPIENDVNKINQSTTTTTNQF